MQYTKSPLSFAGVPQPIMVGDKYVIDIDEEKYNEIIMIPGIRVAYPEADEARIQRLTQLEADIIAIFFETGFYEKKFHWFDQKWTIDKLKEFKRVDDTITETDIIAALKRNVDNQRITEHTFPDGHIKYMYSQYHYEKVMLPEPEPTKPKEGKNPFE